ncbi:MAG: hypothetical protein EB127_03455 [Alphaproteobacteria bacterium]|nr:hypothetical protein [Alphaproteobacteria bacterium]
MRKKKEDSAKWAHTCEQVEAAFDHFSAVVNHYGIDGVLYLKIPSEGGGVFVFSKDNSPTKIKALLTSSAKMSARGAKDIVDKGL